ncbi:MAG: site-specific DNA-methyltransferase [Promethearchaeota archaeon]
MKLTWDGKRDKLALVEGLNSRGKAHLLLLEDYDNCRVEGVGEHGGDHVGGGGGCPEAGGVDASGKVSFGNNWRNRLIHGDNLVVMHALLDEFREKINLIYIDPPFATGSDFKYQVQVGRNKKTSGETDAYKDTWGRDVDDYLTMIHDRLLLMHELLHPRGCIYVHVDEKVSHYVKILLDEIFGPGNFVNEIVWVYKRWTASAKKFQKLHDNILLYSKSKEYTFNTLLVPYEDDERHYTHEDKNGSFRWQHLNGKKYKLYKKKGVKMGDWWYVKYLNSMAKERMNYPTQKPESLLKNIMLASSNEGDLVADFFAGSGTALMVAEKLNRRWIGSDVSPLSILTCRKRLLGLRTSNDLREGKKKYNKPARRFHVLGVKDDAVPETRAGRSDFSLTVEGRENHQAIVVLTGYQPPGVQSVLAIKEEIKEKIKDWSDWIDAWMVDFEPARAFIRPHWVSYRDRWNREIALKTGPHAFDAPGQHVVRVMVIDIMGNKTVKDVEISI